MLSSAQVKSSYTFENVSLCIAELDPSVLSINSNALDPSRLREMLHRPPSVRSRPQRTPLLKLRDFTSTSESTPQTDRSLGIMKLAQCDTVRRASHVLALSANDTLARSTYRQTCLRNYQWLVKTASALRRRSSEGSQWCCRRRQR